MEIKQALGFLGLIAVAVLILIYLLKPNYQQKVISSTFLWKLSLKYKRKRIPVNRIRQLLLFICQILLLVTAVVILTRPFLLDTAELPKNEKILIIDASASMLAENFDEEIEFENGSTRFETRFDRAIERARTLGKSTISDGGLVTVIVAGSSADYAKSEAGKEAARISDAFLLDDILDNISDQCTYGRADINGAMRLAEEVMQSNYTAKTTLITATVYQNVSGVNLDYVYLTDSNDERNENNAAIIDARAELEEGHYTFYVDVVNYNNVNSVTLTMVAYDMSYNILDEKGTIKETKTGVGSIEYALIAGPAPGEVYTFKIKAMHKDAQDLYVSSFDRVTFNIYVEDDCFSYDDDFAIYGGIKPTIKVLYSSSQPHSFMNIMIAAIEESMLSKWDVSLTANYYAVNEEDYGFKGFDFYIFEDRMPQDLPTDGVSLLINPESSPSGIGMTITNMTTGPGDYQMSAGNSDLIGDAASLLSGVNPSNFTLTTYRSIVITDESDADLQQVFGIRQSEKVFDPLFVVKNTPTAKYAVLGYSLHDTDLALLVDYGCLMVNMFNYFIPTTIAKNVNGERIQSNNFEVGEEVSVSTRGQSYQIYADGDFDYDNDMTNYQAVYQGTTEKITLLKPGTFTIEQTMLNPAKTEFQQFYVQISAEESNFNRIDTFTKPTVDRNQPGLDLILYIAIALVALLFIERILYIREEL